MEQEAKLQRMSIYFPVELLEQVRTSARRHKRSFNKEVLWFVERGLSEENEDATGRATHHPQR